MRLSENPIVDGVFCERPNRFIARVILANGQEVLAHVPNTGRMRELLTAGADVRLSYHPEAKRKTAYTLLSVNYQGVWVCVYAAMANQIAASYLALKPEVTDLKREVTFEHSRFDLGFTMNGCPALYEVKSANLVINRTARFPDAPTDRGSRHLLELMSAQRQGYHTGVLFIVMREDADFFAPYSERDPKFAECLANCREKGVLIRALGCSVSKTEIRIDREIPVININ